MKFTWLSSESSFIAANIFEGLFGPLRCSIRYILHQIKQNRHDETESEKASSESVQCFIFNWVYTLHLPNRKIDLSFTTTKSVFLSFKVRVFEL